MKELEKNGKSENEIAAITKDERLQVEVVEKQNGSGQVTEMLLDNKELSGSNQASTSTRRVSEPRFEPPDGGWGWFVVFACFMTFGLMVGTARSVGVMYLDIRQSFPDSTHSQVAMIPGLVTTVTVGLAVVAGALANRFSSRSVAFTGGFVSGVGLSACYGATSVLYMQLCFTFAGIGAGLSCTPAIMMIAIYFKKRRAMATGFGLAGTAVGSFTIPHLLKALMDHYDWRGSLLILGAITFHICPCALFYVTPQPPKRPKKYNAVLTNEQQRSANNELLNDEEEEASSITNRKDVVVSESNNTQVQDTQEDSEPPKYQESVQKSPSSDGFFYDSHKKDKAFVVWILKHLYVDVSLFGNPVFMVVFVTATLMTMGYPISLSFIPAYAEELGSSKTNAALLLSISAGGELFSRLFLGWFFDHKFVNRQWAYFVVTFILASSVILLGACTEYWMLAVAILVFGLAGGGSFLLIPVLLSQHHGPSRLGSSYGIVRFGQSITCLISPPLAGHLRDITGQFQTSFIVMGSAMMFGSMCVLLFMSYAKRLFQQKMAKSKKNADIALVSC